MINVEIVEDLYDCRLSPWGRLLNDSKNPLPFQRYEWVETWWKNYATDKIRPFIMIASRPDELMGIAPLMHKVNSWPRHNSIEFIGSGYFDYFDFILKEGEEKSVLIAFLQYLEKNFSSFELQLKNIFKSSLTFSILKEYVFSGRPTYYTGLAFNEDVVPYIDLPKDEEKFYSQMKKSLRTDIARQEKRLKELGELEFKEAGGLDEAVEVLEDFFSLHIKKWEIERGYSAYKFEQRRNLVRGLLKNWFDEKIANMYYLLLNKKKKLAICLIFKLNRKFIYYAPTYDPEFASYSPGKILINKLINYAIAGKYTEFDFGIGKEPYKLWWPCGMRELYSIYLYRKKDYPLNIFLKLRRRIISSYFLNILPQLRKFWLIVYLWRLLNRKRGKYKRFK